VKAVILAPRIAKLTGKVALDFGKAPRFIRTKAIAIAKAKAGARTAAKAGAGAKAKAKPKARV